MSLLKEKYLVQEGLSLEQIHEAKSETIIIESVEPGNSLILPTFISFYENET